MAWINTPIVLDACTLIHLFSTDLQHRDMLKKFLKNQKLYLSEKVYQEARENSDKLQDREQKGYVQRSLIDVRTMAHFRTDADIQKDLSIDLIQELVDFSKHTGKDNGEFISTMLCLCLSREEQSMVAFYSDDYPALREFEDYFRFHQIGVMGDTADYLMFLYLIHDDFSKESLLNRLQDLYSEYSLSITNKITSISHVFEHLSTSEQKRDNLYQHVTTLVTALKNGDTELVRLNVAFCQQCKIVAIKHIAQQITKEMVNGCEQTKRLSKLIRDVRKYEYFK